MIDLAQRIPQDTQYSLLGAHVHTGTKVGASPEYFAPCLEFIQIFDNLKLGESRVQNLTRRKALFPPQKSEFPTPAQNPEP